MLGSFDLTAILVRSPASRAIETISVIIQVTYFKKTGKRVFKMAPIHHHLELLGWRENQVVILFSIITLIVSVVGLQIV